MANFIEGCGAIRYCAIGRSRLAFDESADVVSRRKNHIKKTQMEEGVKVSDESGVVRVIAKVFTPTGSLIFKGYKGTYCPLNWRRV